MKICIFLFFLLPIKSIFAQNFNEKEINFPSADKSFTLSGTLATPNAVKNPPVIVLISGSGQTDRDESILGHKFFKTLSDYLVQKGIAVLRYDDRGGYKSGGPKTSQSTQIQLASDAFAAVEYLSKIENYKKIGLLGHSEGGGLAPMVATKKVEFIISLAGIALAGNELLIQQNKDIYTKGGVDSVLVDLYIKKFFGPILELSHTKRDSLDFINRFQAISKDFNGSNSNLPFVFAASSSVSNAPVFYKQLCNPWMQDMLATNYIKYWQKVKVPSLALFGSLDQQVNAVMNTAALLSIANKHIEIQTLKEHNHLFQIAKKGDVQEYSKIKYVLSEECLQTISTFILKHASL